jgi:hypothetical protein
MLNGIWVLQGLIRGGSATCGMVVSGEQNMPLAETAAREMRHSFDGQLAADLVTAAPGHPGRLTDDRTVSTGSTWSPAPSTTTAVTPRLAPRRV